jgi:hypothetical protein
MPLVGFEKIKSRIKTPPRLSCCQSAGSQKFILGAILAFVGVVSIVVGGWWYPKKVQEKMNNWVIEDVVIDGFADVGFKRWLHQTGYGGELRPVTQRKFYLFNVTNTEEVLWGRDKPRIKEVGPFIYSVHSNKYDVTFESSEEPSVKFKVYTFVEFDQARSSPLSLDDRIASINLPYTQVLVNLEKHNLTETYLAARFANHAFQSYKKQLMGSFLAEAKRDALSRFLTKLYASLRLQEVPYELGTRYAEMRTAHIPSALNSVYAKVQHSHTHKTHKDT